MQESSLEIAVSRPPVIVLGMHRSGTTMVSELLAELGLFLGADVHEHHESQYFLDANDEVMRQAGGAWDWPLATNALTVQSGVATHISRCLRADLLSWRVSGFLGKGGALGKWGVGAAAITDLKAPWGWKDPRTDFTLPLWLALFPGAKLVRIVRNGVDVASSLWVRELKRVQERLGRAAPRLEDSPSRKESYLERAAFKASARCMSLEGSYSLWEAYVAQEEAVLGTVGNSQATFRYEDFLADPRKHLTELAAFCGLGATAEAIGRAAAKVRPQRANAWTNDPTLRAFHSQVNGRKPMVRFGYGNQ